MGKGKGRKSGAPIILPKARFLTSNSITSTRVKRLRLECGAGSPELKFRRRWLGGGRMLSLLLFVLVSERRTVSRVFVSVRRRLGCMHGSRLLGIL